MRPLRVRPPLRGGCSGCQMPETRINTGVLRVRHPHRVPKNFWAGKRAEYEWFHTATHVFGRFTFPQTFFDPEHPEHPERTSIYAGFSVSAYPEHYPLYPEHPEQNSRNTTFMGKELMRCTMVS
jgi:hypothetical protein